MVVSHTTIFLNFHNLSVEPVKFSVFGALELSLENFKYANFHYNNPIRIMYFSIKTVSYEHFIHP